MSDGAVSQKIIYEFEGRSLAFGNLLKDLYNDMNRIAGGAEKVQKALRAAASDSSGVQKFANSGARAASVLEKMGDAAKDSEKSVKQLSKEMSTLLELSRRMSLSRMNDPTSAKAIADVQARYKAMEKLVVSTRSQAAEQVRANQHAKEALRIAERHNDQLMSMMRRAAAVAASYLSIQQGAKAVKVGVDFNMMIEQNQMAFQVMTKSQSMASSLIKDLRSIQTQTGIGIREGADSAKQLLAYGFQFDGLIKNMTMLKTVAGAVNVPLQDIVYVYGTLRSQGRAYTRDIMQFAMRGIPIYEALAQTMGVSTSQIKKLTEEGAVGFAQVEKAMQFMTSGGGPFSGMLEARMGTLTGKVDLLGKQFETTMGAISAAAMPAITVIVEELTRFLEKLDAKEFGASLRVLFENIADGMPSLAQATASFFKTVVDGMSAMANIAATLMPVISALAQMLGLIAPLLIPMAAGGLLFGGAGKAIRGVGGALSVAAFTSGGKGPLSAVDRGAALELGATGGFKNAMTNIASIMGNMMKSPFFAATAWGVAIAGIAALISMVDNAGKAARASTIATGFSATASPSQRQGAVQAMIADSGFVGGMGVSHVQFLAKTYALSIKDVATALKDAGKISASVFESLTKNVGVVERGSQITERALPAWQGIYDLLNGTDEQLKSLRGAEGSGNSRYGYGANAFTDFGSGALRADVVMQNLPRQTDLKQANFMEGLGMPSSVTDATAIPALEAQVEYLLSSIQKISAFSQATGESETTLLLILGQQYDVLQKQLKAKGKIVEMDRWTILELQAQLSESQLDDIQLEHDKRVASYMDQVKNKTMLQSDADRAIALSQQIFDKATFDYKSQLATDQYNRELDSIQTRHALELAAIDAQDQAREEMRQKNIAAANPLAWMDSMADPFKELQGSLFTGALDALRLGLGQIPFIGAKMREGNFGIAASTAGSAGSDLGSSLLQGAGGLAMGAGTAGVSMLMEAFSQLTGVVKIFQAPLEIASKALHWFSEAITYVVEPLQTALRPIFNLLKPLMAAFAANIQAISAVLTLLTPVFEAMGAVLRFLTDFVIVPLTNFFIMMTNAVISFINIFRDSGDKLKKVDYAKTTTELAKLARVAQENAKALDAQQTAAKKYADMSVDALEYLRKRIRSEADKQIDAYKQLFEVGAISAREYDTKVKALNESLNKVGMGGDSANELIQNFLLDWDTSLEGLLLGIDSFAQGVQNTYDAAYADNFDPVLFNSAKTALENYTKAIIDATASLGGTATTGGTTTPAPVVPPPPVALPPPILPTVPTTPVATPPPATTNLSGDAVWARWNTYWTEYQAIPKHKRDGIVRFEPLEAIRNLIRAQNWEAASPLLAAVGYRVGTPEIIRDQLAMVHQGEGIVPKTFMDAIRGGELTLGGPGAPGGGNGGNITMYVTVQGHVITENELADGLATTIASRQRSGALKVRIQ